MLKKIQRSFQKNLNPFIVFGVIVLALSYVGYNKFLDWQEREDLKQHLSSLIELRDIASAESGQDLELSVRCEKGGAEKFDASYDCLASILGYDGAKNTEPFSEHEEDLGLNSSSFSCGLNEGSLNGYIYLCINEVRPSNEDFTEELFFDYDTTPGRK